MRRACNEHGAGNLEGADDQMIVWSDLPSATPTSSSTPGSRSTTCTRLTLPCGPRGSRPPGRSKILVVGNHDLGGQGALRVAGFHRSKALPMSAGDPLLIWTHAPLPQVDRVLGLDS